MPIPRSRYQQAIDDLRTRLMSLCNAVVDERNDKPGAERRVTRALDEAIDLLEAFTAGRRP